MQVLVFPKILELEIVHLTAITHSFVYAVPIHFSFSNKDQFFLFFFLPPISLPERTPHGRNDQILLNFSFIQNSFRICLLDSFVQNMEQNSGPSDTRKTTTKHWTVPDFHRNSYTAFPVRNGGKRLCHPSSLEEAARRFPRSGST